MPRQDQTTDPLGAWCPTDWLGWITKNTNPTDVVVAEYPNSMKWFAGKTHMMTPVAALSYGNGVYTMTRFTAPTTGFL